jgi:hypothetical protein
LVCELCGNVLAHERRGDDSPDAGARSATDESASELRSPPPHSSESSSRQLPLAGLHDARFDALRKLIPVAPELATKAGARPLGSERGPTTTPSRAGRSEVTSVMTSSRAIDDEQGAATMASRPIASTARESQMDPARAPFEPWLYLAIGLATAPIFAWTSLLNYMGWFLASLVHEMGHAAFAWLCGMPAVPAISLDGHAAAVHSEQSLFLVALVALGLGAGAWHLFVGRTRWIVLAILAVVYPAIALTGAKELFHLLAGHGAELAFATVCLWKTLDGGFTDSRVERALYGTVGWYLLGKNLHLCFGLMQSASARAEYNENGSFGLTNDYIRVAEDVLSCPLEHVALFMLLAGVLVLPAAFGLWRLSNAMRRS